MMAFSKEMIKAGNTCYLIDENDDICKNTLYDSGNGTFYFGDNGKMKVGWWENPKDRGVYFFCNKKGPMYGAMVFGLNMIDGYYRFFGQNGKLVRSNNDMRVDVMGAYTADSQGNLYDKDGNLMRDTSNSKSDFYTDTTYYDNNELNNKTLADTGKILLWDGERYNNGNKSVENYNVTLDKKKLEDFNNKIKDGSGVVVSKSKNKEGN